MYLTNKKIALILTVKYNFHDWFNVYDVAKVVDDQRQYISKLLSDMWQSKYLDRDRRVQGGSLVVFYRKKDDEFDLLLNAVKQYERAKGKRLERKHMTNKKDEPLDFKSAPVAHPLIARKWSELGSVLYPHRYQLGAR